MSVSMRKVVGVMLVLAAPGAEARAQYGYGGWGGGYGWGWGGGAGMVGTPPGNIAWGLGYYWSGLGRYNVDTAMAASINSDTIGRWNEFMFLSQMEANRRARARLDHRMKRDARASELNTKRLRESPTHEDITSGAALNAAFDQLTDPALHSSALRLAKTPINGKLVRAIPFVPGAEAVAISLDRLTATDGWPLALRGEDFTAEREVYKLLVDKALREAQAGEISPGTVFEIRAAVSRIRSKLELRPPADRTQRVDAENFVKTLVGLARMLERPNVERILAELDKVDSIPAGTLLAFMQAFNLRFGRANTLRERNAYAQLFPVLDKARNELVPVKVEVSEDKLAREETLADDKNSRQPIDFFQGMHLDHLEGKAPTTGPPVK
jgi:hypothetical protein